MKINPDKIKIIFNKRRKIKPNKTGELVTRFSLKFDDLTIHGYRMETSKYQNRHGDYLWIKPPAYKGKDGEYHPIVYISPEKWKQITKRVTEEWRKIMPVIEEAE